MSLDRANGCIVALRVVLHGAFSFFHVSHVYGQVELKENLDSGSQQSGETKMRTDSGICCVKKSGRSKRVEVFLEKCSARSAVDGKICK